MTNQKFCLTLSALLTIGSGTLLAQEGDVQEQNSIIISATDDGESGGPMSGTRIMAIESSDMGGGPMVFADSFGGNFEFSGGFAGDSFSMLNNPSVQKDLQLVDDQLKQIKEINREFGEKIKQQMGGLKNENGTFSMQTGENLGQLIRDLKQQQQEQIQNILLPNQQQRLEQVARQMKMKQMGTAQTLTSQLAKELDLSDEQLDRIKSRSKELHQELATRIAEIKDKAREDLLGELTSAQRKKLEELVGDEFVEKDEDTKDRLHRFMGPTRSRDRDF